VWVDRSDHGTTRAKDIDLLALIDEQNLPLVEV